MMEKACVHIRGQLGSLGYSIIQRLLREELDIIVQEVNLKSLNEFFSTELEFSKSNISSCQDNSIVAGNRVLLLGFDNYGASNDDPQLGIGIDGVEVILVTPSDARVEVDSSEVDCHFLIHDMIPSESLHPWKNPSLDDMMESLVRGEDFDITADIGWWVAEVDVADAISRLLLSNHPNPSQVNIAGRRSWGAEQVFEELEMLYNRTIAGQSGDFTTKDLTSPSTPSIELVPVEQSRQNIRPDLKSLHKSLVLADGDGWRPMTPIRTGLMYFLIGKVN